MYGALWRVLPGPWWVRGLILAMLAGAVVAALMLWVFPWIEPIILPQESTVGP